MKNMLKTASKSGSGQSLANRLTNSYSQIKYSLLVRKLNKTMTLHYNHVLVSKIFCELTQSNQQKVWFKGPEANVEKKNTKQYQFPQSLLHSITIKLNCLEWKHILFGISLSYFGISLNNRMLLLSTKGFSFQ